MIKHLFSAWMRLRSSASEKPQSSRATILQADFMPLTGSQRDFVAGRRKTLTSADVDPEGTARYSGYELAMYAKASGDIEAAQEGLYELCKTPNIYKGHYRELFKIWRIYNKQDLHSGSYANVIERVRLMVRLDDEMIVAMLEYWSGVQRTRLASNYFNKNRNLKISDVKAMLKAAKALDDLALINEAMRAAKQFS